MKRPVKTTTAVPPLQLEDDRNWYPVMMRGMVSDLSERVPLTLEHLEEYWDQYGKAPRVREEVRGLRAALEGYKGRAEMFERELRAARRELNRIRASLKTLKEFAQEPDEMEDH